MQEHLQHFSELFAELAVIGDAMEEKDKVISILASLPDSYSIIVTALEAMADVQSMESVTERLLHEESKQKPKNEENALMAGQQTLDKNKNFNTKKNFRCYECSKVGHIKKNCRIFLKKEKESAKITEEKENLMLSISALLVKENCSEFSWIVDSGASNQMCYIKEKFNSFQSLEKSIPVEI